MNILADVNWISFLALTVVLLLFVFLGFLIKKINWTFVILISLVLGAAVGVVFSSENNSYLIWVELIGTIYVNVITALVAPVILVSVISGFISIKDGKKMRSIGVKSVVWLLISAAAAIVISIAFGLLTRLGKNAGAVFEGISSISAETVGNYSALTKSFDEVIAGLFPSNFVGDMGSDNVVAIIITAIAIAVAFISVAQEKGEEKTAVFKSFIDTVKDILYKILGFVIDLTPYAVLCLIASSASKIFANPSSVLQLIFLVGSIYLVALIHNYGFNAMLLKFAAKLNPFKFFKKTLRAQTTAFTTQSSVGTLPVTIGDLKEKVGVDEEIANFTAPLGTTVGMPGCTCIWPVLLAIFFVNATGLNWGVGDYILLAVLTLVFSLGSAGVPGIALVSAIGLFQVLSLPVEAVILLMPINTVSDMIRTTDNVTTAAVASAIVARKENLLSDDKFNDKINSDKKTEE